MFSAIATIIIGIIVAFVLPDWVKFGDKKSRQLVQLIFNVVGILIAVSGVLNLFRLF